MFDRDGALVGTKITNYTTDCSQKWLLLVGTHEKSNGSSGVMQLYSVEQNVGKIFNGYAGTLGQMKFENSAHLVNIFCYATQNTTEGQLHILEIGNAPKMNQDFTKECSSPFLPYNECPVMIHTSTKYDIVYLITSDGNIRLHDLESGKMIYDKKISSEPIIHTARQEATGGIVAVNRNGKVFSLKIDQDNIVSFIVKKLADRFLALRVSERINHNFCDGNVFLRKLTNMMQQEEYTDPAKVIEGFAASGKFTKIIVTAKRIGFTPDYLLLLKQLIQLDPEQGLEFAEMLVQGDNPLADINQIVDKFMEQNLIQQCTALLLKALKNNQPSEQHLQTRLLEMNLKADPKIADDILGQQFFTHYDKPHIAKMCEEAGLLQRALEHFTDLNDIKRVLVQTHLLNHEWFVKYFDSLTEKDSLECLNAMLAANLSQNLEICVQVAVAYQDRLTLTALIDLFETYQSYEGLFIFLRFSINSSQDPHVHFKYIEAACKTNRIQEADRICRRESIVYNPEDVKNLLMGIELSDQLPLITVCDRFDFVHDLVLHLYRNNFQNYIDNYVQQVNPARLPDVITALLEVGCLENVIKNLILSVRGKFSSDHLIQVVEKRNRLELLLQWLETCIQEGDLEPVMHTALAKINIDHNRNPELFLKKNQYYDSSVIGKYCEQKYPQLACVVYEEKICDKELIRVCNENSLFSIEARYLVRRRDSELWEAVLKKENPRRNQIMDKVIQNAILETKDRGDIIIAVEAFKAAKVTTELIHLLKQIFSHKPEFSDNKDFQNLLISTAIKADKSSVMGYINRFENYDVEEVTTTAIQNYLFEEAFTAFKKFHLNESAAEVLIEKIGNLERAFEFAENCNEPAVWRQLAEAQRRKPPVTQVVNNEAGNETYVEGAITEAQKLTLLRCTSVWQQLVRTKPQKCSSTETKDSKLEEKCNSPICESSSDKSSGLEDAINHELMEQLDCTYEEYQQALLLLKQKQGKSNASLNIGKYTAQVGDSPDDAKQSKTKECIQSFEDLDCFGEMENVEMSGEIFSLIQKYVDNSIGSEYTARIHEIREKKIENENHTNPMLLWHKATKTNVLLLNDQSATSTHPRFLFYDRLQPALDKEKLRQIVILCVVDLGDVLESQKGMDFWSNQWYGRCCDSVKCNGRLIPDEDDYCHWNSVHVPCGITKMPESLITNTLEYNEYIIIDKERAITKFAVDLELLQVREK